MDLFIQNIRIHVHVYEMRREYENLKFESGYFAYLQYFY